MKYNLKASKGIGAYFILMITFIVDILAFIIGKLVNVYEIYSLLKVFFVLFNIYQIYYIFEYIKLSYTLEEDGIIINRLFRKKSIIIPYTDIKMYNTDSGEIKGVKLTGFATERFALGESYIDKLGTIRMFVTSSKEIIYLNTALGNYAISPENIQAVKKELDKRNIVYGDWEYKKESSVKLYKDKNFLNLLFITSSIIIVVTAIPLILYIKQKLPQNIPLNYDAYFIPIKFGSSKQFVIKQLTYGALNMGILFCMYFAAYFYAKYDRKNAHRYLYFPLIVTLAFLFMQIRVYINIF